MEYLPQRHGDIDNARSVFHLGFRVGKSIFNGRDYRHATIYLQPCTSILNIETNIEDVFDDLAQRMWIENETE